MAWDQNSPGLRQLQNSLISHFQRLLESPAAIAAREVRPAQSPSAVTESMPKAPSIRSGLLTAGSSSSKFVEGYHLIAVPVDDAFASEIAAQRKIRADRHELAEAENRKRLGEQRVAREEALVVQRAERTKLNAEKEAEKKRKVADQEAEKKRQVVEQESERLKLIAERDVKTKMGQRADDEATTEKQALVEQATEAAKQQRMEMLILAIERGKTEKRLEAERKAERQQYMRIQEKLVEQFYAEHKVDVVKIGTSSGGAMYVPWDSIVGDILDEHKQEELDRKGIYFWLEAGTATSVAQERQSLQTVEDVAMSGEDGGEGGSQWEE
ncbi:chromatin assembly factor-I (CAF-I) p90 subunit [Xylographa carneopallida]|nr:chromatin assembly factor-I (CAF-I) p90 subunit [Xylographa carneopallida]